MSVVMTGSFPKDLLPGVKVWFDAANKAVPAQWKEAFKDSMPSSLAFEEAVAYAGLDLPVQKPEGENISFDAPSQLYVSRIVHNAYASGIVISHEAMMDGQVLKVAQKRAEMLGRSFAQQKNVVAANILNRAFTAGYTGGDGKVLCATDHVTAGANVSNKAATDSDLTEASIEQAMIDISDIRDNRGLRNLLSARKLIVPKELRFEAERILSSELRVGVADNDVNALRSLRAMPEGVAVMDYLTDPDAWFVLTDAEDSLVHYEREPAKVMDEVSFDSMNLKFAMYTRYSMGWHDFRGIYGTPGA